MEEEFKTWTEIEKEKKEFIDKTFSTQEFKYFSYADKEKAFLLIKIAQLQKELNILKSK